MVINADGAQNSANCKQACVWAVLQQNGNVIIETVKQAEEDSNSVILRIYEPNGEGASEKFKFDKDILSCELVNILEENISGLTTEKNVLQLNFTPFEIKTIKIKLKY